MDENGVMFCICGTGNFFFGGYPVEKGISTTDVLVYVQASSAFARFDHIALSIRPVISISQSYLNQLLGE